jgi:DNA invertase Pin-like site-specific DNA recombinase
MNNRNQCAVYLRVSTDAQSTANQRPDVLRLVRARELDVVEIFEENVSATKSRPQYERMMLAAHQGRFGTIVIWSLDRLGRSLTGNVEALLKLDQCGVRVVSVQEPWLDTSGPVRELLVSIFSWVASQERLRISARTKAGLEQAKRRGRVLGRPKKWIDVDRALALRATGMPIRTIAQKLGVGASTLHRALAAHDTVTEATATVVPESAILGAA